MSLQTSIYSLNRLTGDQAQALWDAGGFLILTSLPEASEFGIDGTFHLTRRFSGIKFLPPGLHLITWSSPSTVSSGPSVIPLRSAFLRSFEPKQRFVLAYDKRSETIPVTVLVEAEVISDDHLRSLDPELAPYPFEGLDRWKSLTGDIGQELLDEVLGLSGRVDGITQAEGEDDEEGGKGVEGERRMTFPRFSSKRSWRDGAVGEEVSRYARDKSWLMGHVLSTSTQSDPKRLLGHLELSFILLLHLSSYSALVVYKRLLALFCRSTHILIVAMDYLSTDSADTLVRNTYIALVRVLTAHILTVPDTVFETELQDMDVFYLDEIEALRENLVAALEHWQTEEQTAVRSAWESLKLAGKRFHWNLGDVYLIPNREEDEVEEEEGEYAPMIVMT